VQEVIEKVKPEIVFIELCKSRMPILVLKEEELIAQYSKGFTFKDIQDTIKQGKGLSGILPLLLSSIFSKVMKDLKVVPGVEFRRAYETSVKIGSKVVLGDRPIGITLSRAWGALTLWETIKLIYAIVFEKLDVTAEDIERMKQSDVFTEMLKELTKTLPSLAAPIIYERDMFLSVTLKNCRSRRVVGVVGVGHVSGMKKYWNDNTLRLEELMKVPPKSTVLPLLWRFTKLSLLICIAGSTLYFLWLLLRSRVFGLI